MNGRAEQNGETQQSQMDVEQETKVEEGFKQNEMHFLIIESN